MHDVESHVYPTVIREMIRHENDLTNHRIMWLLIGQGLIANAYVSAAGAKEEIVSVLAPVGILVTLSAFVILYKSYQARGYLEFLGGEAKRGNLTEKQLPVFGWPHTRIKGWRRNIWICPWLGRVGDLLEPYFFLPILLMVAWVFLLLKHWLALSPTILLVMALLLVALFLLAFCVVWVWAHVRDENEAS